MNLSCLPRSVRRPRLRSRLVLAALALLVLVSMVGFGLPAPALAAGFAHAKGAHASIACADDINNEPPLEIATLANQYSGLYLDVDGASHYPANAVQFQRKYIGNLDQQWDLIPTSFAIDDFYIKNVNSGLYLDVSGASTDPGAQVIQYPFNGNANQQWCLVLDVASTYWIVNVNSGLYLDVSGASRDSGAPVIQ